MSFVLCAFTNQSNETVTATVTLNTELIGNIAGAEKPANACSQHGAQQPLAINDGKFSITVEAKGLTPVEIDAVEIEVDFQPNILERTQANAWEKDYLEVSLGNARAMILRGLDNNNAYLYLQSDDAEFSAVALHYEQAGAWKMMHDDAFPFEFTVPLNRADATFTFYFEGRTVDGKVIRSKEEVLQRVVLVVGFEEGVAAGV